LPRGARGGGGGWLYQLALTFGEFFCILGTTSLGQTRRKGIQFVVRVGISMKTGEGYLISRDGPHRVFFFLVSCFFFFFFFFSFF
ncbi:hypothetical protein B0F90DRAFT_1738983, partial [Multifurca ochricompacta]